MNNNPIKYAYVNRKSYNIHGLALLHNNTNNGSRYLSLIAGPRYGSKLLSHIFKNAKSKPITLHAVPNQRLFNFYYAKGFKNTPNNNKDGLLAMKRLPNNKNK